MGGFRLKKKAQGEQCSKEVQGTITGELAVRSREAAPQEGRGHETVRLTLAVPRLLHKRLKMAAVRQERSIVSLVSGWIEEQTAAA